MGIRSLAIEALDRIKGGEAGSYSRGETGCPTGVPLCPNPVGQPNILIIINNNATVPLSHTLVEKRWDGKAEDSAVGQPSVGTEVPCPVAAHVGVEPWRCWWCGSDDSYTNTASQPVCARCHPPVAER